MDDQDTFRILIATDCHLGYMEKDEVRRDDSFKAFEEICRTAYEHKVDFMLLGGDLFHENKPSSTTVVKAIEILRRYCLNDLPVQFQVVSDQTQNFHNRFGHVNYEDPNYNIGLPVFTIHGNHDDPAGVDHISAIDILASSNLVNYFGKVDLGGSGVGSIVLHPILLRKGLTKIALYGLGNIRDERLNRIFQVPNGVQWIRPADQEDCPASSWFNMFVLHQNRVKSNPKNAINEHFLPRFLDFVVWGHEHESLADPQEIAGMGFHVSQPGSSIATSLTEGEASPKHILMMEIQGNKYRPTKIPLKTVRPFKHADIRLKDEMDLDMSDAKTVIEFLDKRVQELIHSAIDPTKRPDEQVLPLIRVRVDYTDYSTVNAQKFGQRFVGKAANPQDILFFTKTKKSAVKKDEEEYKERLRPEELNQHSIEALIAETDLATQIVPVNDFSAALQEYVVKEDKSAFQTCVEVNVQDAQEKLLADEDEPAEQDIEGKVQKEMEKRKHQPSTIFTSSAARASTSAPQASRVDDTDDFGDDTPAVPQTASKTRTSRKSAADDDADGGGRGRGRGRGRARGGGRGRGAGRQSSLKQTTLDMPATSSRRYALLAFCSLDVIFREGLGGTLRVMRKMMQTIIQKSSMTRKVMKSQHQHLLQEAGRDPQLQSQLRQREAGEVEVVLRLSEAGEALKARRLREPAPTRMMTVITMRKSSRRKIMMLIRHQALPLELLLDPSRELAQTGEAYARETHAEVQLYDGIRRRRIVRQDTALIPSFAPFQSRL